MVKKPIWIEKEGLDKQIYYNLDPTNKEYYVWVKMIQGYLYRLKKTYKNNKELFKLTIIGLQQNYEKFFDSSIEHHLQSMFYILSTLVKNVKKYNLSEEDVEVLKHVVRKTYSVAKEYDYKFKKMTGGKD